MSTMATDEAPPSDAANGASAAAASADQPTAPDQQDMSSEQPPPQQQTQAGEGSSSCTAAAPNEDTLAQLQTQLDALESMRRANLEVEFSGSPAALKVSHERCTHCQREERAAAELRMAYPTFASGAASAAAGSESGIAARLKQLNIDGHRIRSLDGRRLRGLGRRFLSKSSTAAVGVGDASEHNQDAGAIHAAADVADCETTRNQDAVIDVTTSEKAPQDADTTDNPANLHLTESCPARLQDQDSFVSGSTANSSKSRRSILRSKSSPACLTCGHPTCPKHTSPTFSTHHIQICLPCAYLFELDFLVDIIAQATLQTPDIHTTAHTNAHNDETYNSKAAMQQCQLKVNSMIDCYDRAKLLLAYTAQYAPQISNNLQSRTATSNKIGITANASGIASGITGIVGAGALLCPPLAAAGVPILIASLVFGGTATAAHTGDYAAVKYWSEPNMLADKMVVLHGMCLSLLRVVEVLNYGLLNSGNKHGKDCSTGATTVASNDDHAENRQMDNNNAVNDEKKNGDDTADNTTNNEELPDTITNIDKRQALAHDIQSILQKHGVNTKLGKQSLSTGTNISGSNIANRSSRFLGRVGTTAAASFRFVPLAGGVLSAASLVVEAKDIKATLSRMNEGNPCEKSEQILEIAGEVERLPDAALIAGECARVFEEAVRERQQATVVQIG